MDKVLLINELGTKLNSAETGLSFLRLLNTYLETIHTDTFLSKALSLMLEYHERESMELTKLSSSPHTEIASIQSDIQEDIDKKYPVYYLRQILGIQKDFQHIKQYRDESEIPDIVLDILDEDPYLISNTPRKLSLKRIPKVVDLLGYRHQFSEFHHGFIGFIDSMKSQGGLFSKYLSYDEEKSILYFKGKPIEINERNNLTNAHFLLKYLFENSPFEKHFYDELNENNALDHKSTKSYYDACVDIKNKVAEVTGVTDFLDFSSGKGLFVRINPDYSINNS